jgi:multidrug resistance efflux pump
VAQWDWLFGKTAHALGIAVVMLGAGVLVAHFDRFTSQLQAVWGPPFFLLVVLASGLCVHAPRAIAQGLACERRGVHVPEVGVVLRYHVLPSLYCDTTGRLWMRRKADRLGVSFSGIYVPFLVCAVAAVAWASSTAGSWLSSVWMGILVSGLVGQIFLNLNPLMRMDAYHLLADWLEIPRLRERALASFGAFLYGRPQPEALSRSERRWFVFYGALVCAYGGAHVCLMLVPWWTSLTASHGGRGALATFMVGLFVLQKPVGEYVVRLRPVQWLVARRAGARRWLARGGIVLAILLVGLIPYPYETGGPFTLLPTSKMEIHTEIEGQIDSVSVREGQWVTAGQVLAVLSKREYEARLKATRAEMVAAEADLRLLRAGPKPEEVNKAEEEVARGEQETGETEQEVRQAEVRLGFSQARASRYAQLYRDEVISRQAYEDAIRERDMATQELEVAKRRRSVSLGSLEVTRAHRDLVKSGARQEQIERTEAELLRLQAVADDFAARLRLTEIRSPVAGRIVTPRVEQKAGQYLEIGDLFAVVEDAGILQAEVEVPEEDAADVREGARVRVVGWAHPSTTFLGHVVLVAPIATERTDARDWRAVRVLTALPNRDGLLKTDFSGYAKIKTPWRPLWKVLLWPAVRWFMVQVWFWLP